MKKVFSSAFLSVFLSSMMVLGGLLTTFTMSVEVDSIIRVPADYPTIQEAINAASPGNVVLVTSGTYYEHVTVNKPLMLVGEDKATTIIDGNGTGTAVSVTADNVVINGFTMRNSGRNGYWSFVAGIYVHSSSNEITGNTLLNNNYGIIFGDENTISGNNVQNNNYGIYGDGRKNVISGNTVSDNPRYGIWFVGLLGNDFNTVTGNIVSNSQYGISLCGWIPLGGTASLDFRHNILQGSSKLSSPPLSNNTISGNMVTGCEYGIDIELGSGNTVITGNTITSNNIGLSMNSYMYSSNHIIYHNNFINNTDQVYITAGNTNTWDDGYPSAGNYWSDFEERYPDVEDVYSGPYQNETGSDGIWDHPYVIDENNQDNYPIVPEFPTWASMLLILIVLTVAIVTYKRRLFCCS